jgi:four helix bundle protein
MDNKFEKLAVWKLAHKYTLEIYSITAKFPKNEMYSLIDQLRRSASSVPTNIVEGNGRQSRKEFVQFLYTAKGSLDESKYQLLLARDLGFVTEECYKKLQDEANEIEKMLGGLVKYLRS